MQQYSTYTHSCAQLLFMQLLVNIKRNTYTNKLCIQVQCSLHRPIWSKNCYFRLTVH